MQIPLIYPKIPENSNNFSENCFAFEKYDGTNMHWCWNQVDGWTHFGTRRTRFQLNFNGITEFNKIHSELSNSLHIFNDLLRDKLSIFLAKHEKFSLGQIIVFTEFHGPNSFAGSHSSYDEVNNEQQLTLIDVSVNNDILHPHVFIQNFIEFNSAKLIYTGKYTGQFSEDVRRGKYPVNEGVVCKGISNGYLVMTKIKTNEYLKRLEHR